MKDTEEGRISKKKSNNIRLQIYKQPMLMTTPSDSEIFLRLWFTTIQVLVTKKKLNQYMYVAAVGVLQLFSHTKYK